MNRQQMIGQVKDKKSCHVWTGTKWKIRSVTDILPLKKKALVRCPVCHGPVVLMSESANGRKAAHFEHHPTHSGCSLAYKIYSGINSFHPQAINDPLMSATDYISETAAEKLIGPVSVTEKKRLMLSRVGQGAFRTKLLGRWQKTCSVLDCGPETALIASHIVSWSTCETNEERLDINNGLLLSPNLDKLFDRKMISFFDNGVLVVSPDLRWNDAIAFGIRPGMHLRRVPSGIVKFLKRHREGKEWSIPNGKAG